MSSWVVVAIDDGELEDYRALVRKWGSELVTFDLGLIKRKPCGAKTTMWTRAYPGYAVVQHAHVARQALLKMRRTTDAVLPLEAPDPLVNRLRTSPPVDDGKRILDRKRDVVVRVTDGLASGRVGRTKALGRNCSVVDLGAGVLLSIPTLFLEEAS